MAHSLQAKKRIRQNERRRLDNKSVKSELKTLTKKFQSFIESSQADEAKELYPVLISKMDKASRKHIFHRNTIARKKSALTQLLNSLQS